MNADILPARTSDDFISGVMSGRGKLLRALSEITPQEEPSSCLVIGRSWNVNVLDECWEIHHWYVSERLEGIWDPRESL
jgi:hypothetical protein